MDAIDFIRKCYDRRILGRRFFIKLGRQSKEIAEEWTGVGYVPKSFKYNSNFKDRKKEQSGKPKWERPPAKEEHKEDSENAKE